MGRSGHNDHRYADDDNDGSAYYVNEHDDDIFITVFYDEYNDYHAPAKCHCGRYNPCRHHNDDNNNPTDDNYINNYAEHDDNVAAFFANYRRRFLHHLDHDDQHRPGS